MNHNHDDQRPETSTDSTRTSEVRLAQPIESKREHERESATVADPAADEWVQFDPFHSEGAGMCRLTVGCIGTGKTVGVMATASRVLDTVPDARIVVFNPISGEYDPLAHNLSEYHHDSETGDIPSAKQFQVGDGGALSVSADDLPALSIIEADRASLANSRDSMQQAVEDFLSELSEAERQWPTYLILDEAHQIFRSDSGVGFRELIQAQQEHGALAVQVVTQAFDDLPLPLEESIEHVEDANRPVHLFDTFDLYYSPSPTLRKRFGLSSEDAEFLRYEATPGFAGGDDEQRAAPTGLCQTPDGDWQRVRYSLTDREAEALLERRSDPYQRHRDTASGAGGV